MSMKLIMAIFYKVSDWLRDACFRTGLGICFVSTGESENIVAVDAVYKFNIIKYFLRSSF